MDTRRPTCRFWGCRCSLSRRAADGTDAVEVLAESREEPSRRPQAFSPDGRMLVFETFPAPSKLSRLTLDGSRTATSPLAETVFGQRNAVLAPDRWQISSGGGAVSSLFDTTGCTSASLDNNNRRYAVAPDGQRFLFLKAASTATADDASQRLMFVENWFEELKQRVPN